MQDSKETLSYHLRDEDNEPVEEHMRFMEVTQTITPRTTPTPKRKPNKPRPKTIRGVTKAPRIVMK